MVEFDGTSVAPSRSVATCWTTGEGVRLLGATAPRRRQVRRDKGPILPRVTRGGGGTAQIGSPC
eukprot:2649128-Rhodomonas_salina.1